MSACRAAVVVSFAALDGDPYERDRRTGRYREPRAIAPTAHWGPTLRALADPHSALHGRVAFWYYLCHPVGSLREVGGTAMEVAEATREAIEERVPARERPRFEPVQLRARGAPHDYAEIYSLVVDELRRVRKKHPSAEIVLMLSAGTAAMSSALLLAGAVGAVSGPLRLVQVERNEGARLRPTQPIVEVELRLDTVLRVAEETHAADPGVDDAPAARYDQAESPALRRALDEVRAAAPLPFPVLLRGERGVGKSRLARYVRALSRFQKRANDAAWPAVACGQFGDPQLMRAELCGSKRGAFTGAEDRTGLLALANGDTLFLDEIHDLSAQNQRVIIRVLEDGIYHPVGSTKAERSKFRLVTGTNLADAELRRRLAPDFYDRIRDIEIHIPPLRECAADLGWMWQAAWRDIAGASRLGADSLGDGHEAVVARLQTQRLPGNWRDLRRLAVRLAMLVHTGDRISASAVGRALDEFFEHEEVAPGDGSPSPPRQLDGRDLAQLRQYEQSLGAGLERFWAAAGRDRTPRQVLVELCGDRGRADRAQRFIAKVFPERWLALTQANTR